MATIDLTLDSFKVPAIENYTPPFGTKIVKTDANKGGLSTIEVNSNIMMPFANMRPKVITENSTTTEIEYDAKLIFSSSLQAAVTLGLDDATYEGCHIQFTNLSAFDCDVIYDNTIIVTVPAGENIEAVWNGSIWILTTTGTVATGNYMAPTSSAVRTAITNAISNALTLTETVVRNTDSSADYSFTAEHNGFAFVSCGLESSSTESRYVYIINQTDNKEYKFQGNGVSWKYFSVSAPLVKGKDYILRAKGVNGAAVDFFAVIWYFND